VIGGSGGDTITHEHLITREHLDRTLADAG